MLNIAQPGLCLVSNSSWSISTNLPYMPYNSICDCMLNKLLGLSMYTRATVLNTVGTVICTAYGKNSTARTAILGNGSTGHDAAPVAFDSFTIVFGLIATPSPSPFEEIMHPRLDCTARNAKVLPWPQVLCRHLGSRRMVWLMLSLPDRHVCVDSEPCLLHNKMHKNKKPPLCIFPEFVFYFFTSLRI
ncbi:hypothetical protein BKA93DRAFT_756305 [Sparassis latifolia]